MSPDEIRERFTAITLIRNPSSFIFGITRLLALYAIARVLRGEPRVVGYADSGNDLRRLVMQQLRIAKFLTQRDGALMQDLTPKMDDPQNGSSARAHRGASIAIG